MGTHTASREREDILKRLAEVKKDLGKDLLILVHYYEHDDIVRFADFVGDSLQLAEKASLHKDARAIVFCSVSFMAETARILAAPGREVLHPEPGARCPLADMAALPEVEAAWKELESSGKEIVPVVYVNSNADLKAFCGRNGGMVATSANVKRVFESILSRDKSVFFFPDENMGRNVSRDLGLTGDEICLWDPGQGPGPAGWHEPEKARVFLWKGYCIVHQVMGREDVERVRRLHEGIKIVVHPECTPEVYGSADCAGSTSFIRNIVASSEPSSKWAIGTELNFVNRVIRENPDKFIVPLREERCEDMAKVTPGKLLHVLEGVKEGRLYHRVTVDPDTARDAKTALQRMLELG